MLQPFIPGVITRVLDETANTKRYFFKVPSIENFDFKPGQFVTLDLPIHEIKNRRWRSYSIASAPSGDNTFELVIVLLEGGAGTTWLWQNAFPGTEIMLRGPQGKFTLPSTIENDLYFICTGTGIAPFRSMVHHIVNHQIPHKNIYLIFGCRYLPDGLYMQELKALQEANPEIQFLPTFSRENPNNGQNLRIGYVHKVYEELINKSKKATEEGVVLKPANFYLCGWKNMVDEAKQRILDLGYDKKAIHLELYG